MLSHDGHDDENKVIREFKYKKIPYIVFIFYPFNYFFLDYE